MLSLVMTGQANAELLIIEDSDFFFTVDGESSGFNVGGGLFNLFANDDQGKIQPFGPSELLKNNVLSAGVFVGKDTIDAVKLGFGDQVDASTGDVNSSESFFYRNGDEGAFGNVGDSGFVGVEVISLIDDIEVVNYGWFEVLRGSLTIQRRAIETTPGLAAQIPDAPIIDVPEPATLPLMALGAAGLIAMRRCKVS